jgi:osmotically-inducible protein OsmY
MARRARCQRRIASNRLAALAMAIVGGAGVLALTSEARPAPDSKTDSTLQLQIRDSLTETPAIAKLNIGVRVRDGVVTLQGPVPTRNDAENVVVLVRKMAGVSEVRDELYTPGADDRLSHTLPRPVTTQRAALPAEKPPPLTVSPPPIAAQPVSLSLAEQIERLRQRDRRFADIRVDVKEGRVTLRGRVVRSQDAWDFAEQVGRLPGVTGVVQGIATQM